MFSWMSRLLPTIGMAVSRVCSVPTSVIIFAQARCPPAELTGAGARIPSPLKRGSAVGSFLPSTWLLPFPPNTPHACSGVVIRTRGFRDHCANQILSCRNGSTGCFSRGSRNRAGCLAGYWLAPRGAASDENISPIKRYHKALWRKRPSSPLPGHTSLGKSRELSAGPCTAGIMTATSQSCVRVSPGLEVAGLLSHSQQRWCRVTALPPESGLLKPTKDLPAFWNLHSNVYPSHLSSSAWCQLLPIHATCVCCLPPTQALAHMHVG